MSTFYKINKTTLGLEDALDAFSILKGMTVDHFAILVAEVELPFVLVGVPFESAFANIDDEFHYSTVKRLDLRTINQNNYVTEEISNDRGRYKKRGVPLKIKELPLGFTENLDLNNNKYK